MIESLIAFLGGSAFRMLWGEIASAWTKYQDHRHEIAMLEIQSRIDAQRHAQQLEMVRVQAEAGVQVIRVRGEADVATAEASAWVEAVRATTKPTGVRWIDGWNGSIRPALATLAGLLIAGDFIAAEFVLSDQNRAIVSAGLGVFLADRALGYRGK
jgi:hypothetical protein